MGKATTTIRQTLNHKPEHSAWFAANQCLFNQVTAFYFSVIQAHEVVLELGDQKALTTLEQLTHATKNNPHPLMPLSDVAEDIPAMFRRSAIHAALGSARSFYSHLKAWRARKGQMQARGKPFTERPPVSPRSWNKSATIYAGQWKERSVKSIMLSAERSTKVEGVSVSQAACGEDQPSIAPAGHGSRNGHGTAQKGKRRQMGQHSLSIPTTLRSPMQ